MMTDNVIHLSVHRNGDTHQYRRVTTEMLKAFRLALDATHSITDRQIAEIARRVECAAEAWCSESDGVPIRVPDGLVDGCSCDWKAVVKIGAVKGQAHLLELVTLERVLAEVEALCGTQTRMAISKIIAKDRPGSVFDI